MAKAGLGQGGTYRSSPKRVYSFHLLGIAILEYSTNVVCKMCQCVPGELTRLHVPKYSESDTVVVDN